MKNEIIQAIKQLSFDNKVVLFEDTKLSENIITKIQTKFVIGNPRVWWLKFIKKPQSFTYDTKYLYKQIINFFKPNESVWIVIEDDTNFLLLSTIEDFINIVGECNYFEYNIINLEMNKLLCENDHDELLLVEL
ncbi:hypothetical protein [Apibacter adventoris]|uniref:Uncharacterized protein n=1 Tax=Apibacter adventoris TaxID=1679466 RepID=A0A2S8AG33_9FLAO|nr:hypothetical protein [Apibacter adventoris]PQL95243.1 hypothetical protein C4S77_00090 [Apibacter adventoris]